MKNNLPLVTSVVNGIIFDKTSKKESFTAYDVTKAARTIVGTDVNVDHNDVKALVHSAFLNGTINGYDREVDTSIAGNPYVYSPSNPLSALSNAVQTQVKTVTQAAQNTVRNVPSVLQNSSNPIVQAMNSARNALQGTQNTTPATPQAQQAAATTSVLSRNGDYVRVLKEAVNKCGFRPGDIVFATYSPASKVILVTSSQPKLTNDPMAVTRPYAVDSKSNIRVSLKTLGADKNKSFIATPIKGQVTISCG